MADFTITVPDPFVPRAVDPVGARALHIENLPVTQKILAAWGETSVSDLTAKEKGELVLLVHLWTLIREWERNDAMNTAGAEADQSALDDFNP